MKAVYKTISYATYPALWATLGVSYLSLNSGFLWQNMLLSLLLHSIIPLGFVWLMVKRGKFESLEIPQTKHRSWVVVFSLICALVFSSIVLQENTIGITTETPQSVVIENLEFEFLIMWNQLILLSLIVQWLFNRFSFKISIHVLSVIGFFTFFIAMSNIVVWDKFWEISGIWNQPYIIIIGIIISALVAISRKQLKSHKNDELIVGAAIGISIVFINFYLYEKLGSIFYF
jgi:hypothetical protein